MAHRYGREEFKDDLRYARDGNTYRRIGAEVLADLIDESGETPDDSG